MTIDYETELAQIKEDYASGSITRGERDALIRELERERRMAPVNAAKLPYDAEIEW